MSSRRDEQRHVVEALKRALAENGGNRLEQLAADIRKREHLRDARRKKAERYQSCWRLMDEIRPARKRGFWSSAAGWRRYARMLKSRKPICKTGLPNLASICCKNVRNMKHLAAEIASLKARRSNIETDQIKIREALCSALKVAGGGDAVRRRTDAGARG